MKLSDLFYCGFIVVVAAGPHQFARQTTETKSHPTQVELRARASTTVPARIEKRILAPSNCGWINGIEASPLDCGEDATCVIALNDNKGTKISAGGCCGSTGCNTFRTACSASRDACSSSCKANPAILYCDNEDVGTLCATYSYPGGQSDLRCVKTKGNTLNIAFTYTGFSTPVPLPRLAANITICNTANSGKCTASLDVRTQAVNTVTTTTKPTTSLKPTSTNPTSTNPTSTSSTSTSPTSTTPTPTETSPPLSEKPQSSTPAIVGGVVGGVGALGAILGAIFYLLFWKKRGARKTDHQPILAASDDASGASGNPALGAAIKAELPATESRPISTYPASFHDDPTKNTPEHSPERYEMNGIQMQQQQQQPLIMELDASEAQQHRRT